MIAQREAPWWWDLPELDEPHSDYLAELSARNDHLFAECRARFAEGSLADLDAINDAFGARLHAEHEELVRLNPVAIEAYWEGQSRDYDVEQEG